MQVAGAAKPVVRVVAAAPHHSALLGFTRHSSQEECQKRFLTEKLHEVIS